MASFSIRTGVGHALLSFDGCLAPRAFWLLGIAMPVLINLTFWPLSIWASELQFGGSGALDGVVQVTNVVATLVLFVSMTWVFFATATKRLHDVNLSGWWAWLVLIPYVGWSVLFIMCCWPSRHTNNPYLNAEMA